MCEHIEPASSVARHVVRCARLRAAGDALRCARRLQPALNATVLLRLFVLNLNFAKRLRKAERETGGAEPAVARGVLASSTFRPAVSGCSTENAAFLGSRRPLLQSFSTAQQATMLQVVFD